MKLVLSVANYLTYNCKKFHTKLLCHLEDIKSVCKRVFFMVHTVHEPIETYKWRYKKQTAIIICGRRASYVYSPSALRNLPLTVTMTFHLLSWKLENWLLQPRRVLIPVLLFLCLFAFGTGAHMGQTAKQRGRLTDGQARPMLWLLGWLYDETTQARRHTDCLLLWTAQ